MPILIVSAAVIVGGVYGLYLVFKRPTSMIETVASYQRRQRCDGSDHVWPVRGERA